MKTGQTTTELFQEFDLYALRTDYMKNNKILIRMAEKKIPRQLVPSLFIHRTPSTVYQTWKQAIIDANNIKREFHDATSHHPTTAAPSSKDAASAHPKPTQTNAQLCAQISDLTEAELDFLNESSF